MCCYSLADKLCRLLIVEIIDEMKLLLFIVCLWCDRIVSVCGSLYFLFYM